MTLARRAYSPFTVSSCCGYEIVQLSAQRTAECVCVSFLCASLDDSESNKLRLRRDPQLLLKAGGCGLGTNETTHYEPIKNSVSLSPTHRHIRICTAVLCCECVDRIRWCRREVHDAIHFKKKKKKKKNMTRIRYK